MNGKASANMGSLGYPKEEDILAKIQANRKAQEEKLFIPQNRFDIWKWLAVLFILPGICLMLFSAFKQVWIYLNP